MPSFPASRLILQVWVCLLLYLAICGAARGQQLGIVSDLTEERTVQPGATYDRSLLLRNRGDTPLPVTLEKKDYHFSHQGTRSYLPPDTLTRSNAGWISLSSSTVTVPPDTTMAVGYRVEVPSGTGGATAVRQGTSGGLEGTYWSVLMVEPGRPSNPTGEGRLQFVETFRYAIQVVTHIGSTGERSVDILSTNVDTTGGGRRLVTNLQNNGTRSLTPDVRLELYDSAGTLVQKTPVAESNRIYPTTSARFTVPLDSVSSGPYTGILVIDGGEGALFGAQLDLKL